ncbi:MAG: hypothetical protein KGQ79_02385 [Proteobacteria bacterium]|nr:hypothetical protein [Pseudomonadota bacterium]
MIATSPGAMAPTPAVLRNAIAIGAVSGGSNTNPLWMSEVSDSNFHDALQESLANQSMLAAGNARYTLDVLLVSLQQPYISLNTTVTADVRYTLHRGNGTQVVYSTELSTPYTASVLKTPIGFMRLQVANEGAMRTNITSLISALRAAAQPGQPLAN